MSTQREKFAQAIKETIDKTSYYVWTRPTESDPYVLAVDGDVDAGAIADAIMPLIRQAQAEALEETATFLKPSGVVWYGDGGVTVYADGAYGGNRMELIDWLEARAAAYRVGEEADHD